MTLRDLQLGLRPSPAKFTFMALILMGWALLIIRPMNFMISRHSGTEWIASDFAKAFAMWGIMVLAMMVPTLTPLFRTRNRISTTSQKMPWFILGFVLSWLGFCIAATALQWGLRSLSLLDTHMATSAKWLSAGLLVGAGLFQFTIIKQFQLKTCRLSLKRVRGMKGDRREFALSGLDYGTDCIKCCWPMMLTMFVFGLMNLWAMAALTVIMVFEKSVKNFQRATQATGALFILAGLAVFIL